MFRKFSSKLVHSCFFRRNVVSVPPAAGKSKKKIGKYGAAVEKIKMPVETNADKLVNFVCGSNILKVGEDIKLKPDDEYPDWLWNIYTGKPKPLEEMDPESKAYWLKVRKMARVRNNKLTKIRRF